MTLVANKANSLSAHRKCRSRIERAWDLERCKLRTVWCCIQQQLRAHEFEIHQAIMPGEEKDVR